MEGAAESLCGYEADTAVLVECAENDTCGEEPLMGLGGHDIVIRDPGEIG